jgi:hypothetical protein
MELHQSRPERFMERRSDTSELAKHSSLARMKYRRRPMLGGGAKKNGLGEAKKYGTNQSQSVFRSAVGVASESDDNRLARKACCDQEVYMFRQLIIALTAAAALSITALAPTSASAWGGGWGYGGWGYGGWRSGGWGYPRGAYWGYPGRSYGYYGRGYGYYGRSGYGAYGSDWCYW